MVKYKTFKFINGLTYFVIIAGIIALSIIISNLRSEGFSNKIKELFGSEIPYIYPEQLKSLCGLGTKPKGQRCVPDNEVITDILIDQKFINTVDGNIVFTPDYNPSIELPAIPDWFNHWKDKGTYSCQKVISWGECNIPGNNCESPCRCGDCAGWRGGNLTDCDNKTIGKGRVWCNLEPGEPYTFNGEPDKCECAYGYCAINGLCVSPYLMNGTKNNKRCCPECAFKSPDKQGGCAGGVICDPNIQCEEAIVEVPGKQYKFDMNNQTIKDHVKIVTELCPSSSTIGDCYHPQNDDARRQQPYVKVSPTDSNNLQSLIGNPVNTAHGQNEYDCALKCGDIQDDTEFSGTINSVTGLSNRLITVQTNTTFSFNEIQNGDYVIISGVEGNKNANGRFLVDNVQPSTKGSFRLVDSSSNGNYISGGTFVREKRQLTVGSQVECSKRCLPKLWRWYPIFDNSEGSLNYTGGYYQSDELMRYLSSEVSLKICPPETCPTEQNIPEFSTFNNCTECEGCKYEYADFPNGNGFYDSKYTCERCNQCLITQPDGLNDTNQIVCKNMTNCDTCINAIQSTVIQGVNYNECDTCTDKTEDDPKSGCKVYTLDPYITNTEGVAKFRPEATTYNHGADPFVDYSESKIEAGYDPNTRNSNCDFYVVNGNKTCDNTLDGKKGWGDGWFYSIDDCTKYCD